MMRILAVFPGQGSQKVGMGKDLAERFPVAKELFQEADEALGFGLSKICFEGPAEKLTLTAIAQPAILTVSVICFRLAEKSLLLNGEIVASAGHSLGEYSALVAAESLKFYDAVRLVNKRGTYMQEAVAVGVGKMVAVLGQEVGAVETALQKVTAGTAQIANINAPGQIVIAGDKAGVDEFVSHLPGAKVTELQVSAPFHCSLMKEAELRLRADLQNISIGEPKFPVYANYTAKSHNQIEEIRENLSRQVCGKVRWVECMENAISETSPTAAYEFGAGTVLTGLLKRINSGISRNNINSAETIPQS